MQHKECLIWDGGAGGIGDIVFNDDPEFAGLVQDAQSIQQLRDSGTWPGDTGHWTHYVEASALAAEREKSARYRRMVARFMGEEFDVDNDKVLADADALLAETEGDGHAT